MNSQGMKGNTQSLNHNTPEVCFFKAGASFVSLSVSAPEAFSPYLVLQANTLTQFQILQSSEKAEGQFSPAFLAKKGDADLWATFGRKIAYLSGRCLPSPGWLPNNLKRFPSGAHSFQIPGHRAVPPHAFTILVSLCSAPSG